ncbi:unnamed protein product [Pseudo-nitzschia multistriata]|uniref:Uncharacterized protein n=1 Tax=Pseudo-nitzschia multistriata TaxID=183589 RepID=A0A448Z2D6_9STRA|nr:unnamed protein product [Pseudo-nitzschia multistriata]
MSGVPQEYSKLKHDDSPDLSVPSTTALSYSSSPESLEEEGEEEEVSKRDSVRRTLFDMSKDVDSPMTSIVKAAMFASSPNITSPTRKAARSPDGNLNGVADTGSTTSSQTTAIPAWNLSMKDAAEKNVEVPLNHFMSSQPISLLTSPISFASDETQTPSSPSSSSSSSSSSAPVRSDPLDGKESQWTNTRKNGNFKKNNDVEAEQRKQPAIIMEDPPEEPTSCNAALNLTPVQLAEIFLAFGQSARQRYQGSEQTEKATTATDPEIFSPIEVAESTSDDTVIDSPPPIMKSSHFSDSSNESEKTQYKNALSRVRILEGELDVLKIGSQRDAQKILSLRQAVDTQKQLNALKELEIAEKETEIETLEERIKTLQKEQEGHIEKETELIETIEILKNELDKITSLKSVPSDEIEHPTSESTPRSDRIDSDESAAEIKLKASRIKEQQDRIIELENALKEKRHENFDLMTQIDWLNCQQRKESQNDVDIQNVDAKETPEFEGSPSIEVESVLKDIMKRLEAMENQKKERQVDDTEKPGNGEQPRRVESEHNGVKVNVSEDPNAIEAMAMRGKLDRSNGSENQLSWCCDWSLAAE